MMKREEKSLVTVGRVELLRDPTTYPERRRRVSLRLYPTYEKIAFNAPRTARPS